MSDPLKQGIWLHRKVDSYTDSHSAIKELRYAFPKNIRRMSGVCIDIWFDHLLLCENPVQTAVLDKDFFDAFYRELAAFDVDSYPYEAQSLAFNLPHFRRVRAGLLQHHWLENYRQATTCLKAFESVEARLQHKIQFAQSAFAFIQENQELFHQVFLAFYPQLTAYTEQLCSPETTTPAH